MLKKIVPALALIIGFSAAPLLTFAQVPTSSSTAVQPAGSGALCPSINRDLDLGMRGDDVRQLQQFLRSQNYFTYPTDTGYFYAATAQAVRAFQTARGIVSTGTARTTGYGVVGPKTRAEIAAICGTVVSNTSPSTVSTTVLSTVAQTSAPSAPTASPACVSNSNPRQELPVDIRIREGNPGTPPIATQPHSETINYRPGIGGTLFAEGLYSDGVWKPLSTGVTSMSYSLQSSSHKVYAFKMNGDSLGLEPAPGHFAQVWNGSDRARHSMPVLIVGSPDEGTTYLWPTTQPVLRPSRASFERPTLSVWPLHQRLLRNRPSLSSNLALAHHLLLESTILLSWT